MRRLLSAGNLWRYLAEAAIPYNQHKGRLQHSGAIHVQFTASLRLISATAVTVILMCGTAPAAAPWSDTRKTVVTDPQYQMTAFTLEVPADWKFAGTIAHDPGCHASSFGLKFSIQSPDGSTAMSVLPGMTWAWTTAPSLQKIMEQSHCPAVDIDSAAAFLVNIAVPNLRPNAKIVSVLPLDAEAETSLAGQLQQMRQQNEALSRQYRLPPQKINLEGARVRLQYIRDGHPVEEQILSVVSCNESQFPAMNAQPAYMRRTCVSRSEVIYRAPAGHLDEFIESPQLKALNKSVQADSEWSARVAQDQMAAYKKFQIANNDLFQAMLQKGRDDTARMLANGKAFQDQQRAATNSALANDRASAHATALNSLDRREFRNPATGQVIEASNQYNHQWVSSDGSTLIQTNDHTFDPNGVVNPVSQSWTELVPR